MKIDGVAIAAGNTFTTEASDVLRNSNDTSRDVADAEYTKKKECLLNADLVACRVKFHLYIDTMTGQGTSYTRGRLYKNGVAIGTEREVHEDDGASASQTFSEDFADFVEGDLIQVYCWREGYMSGAVNTVSNLRFYYSEWLSHVGDRELTTHLSTEEDPTISMTNQDP